MHGTSVNELSLFVEVSSEDDACGLEKEPVPPYIGATIDSYTSRVECIRSDLSDRDRVKEWDWGRSGDGIESGTSIVCTGGVETEAELKVLVFAPAIDLARVGESKRVVLAESKVGDTSVSESVDIGGTGSRVACSESETTPSAFSPHKHFSRVNHSAGVLMPDAQLDNLFADKTIHKLWGPFIRALSMPKWTVARHPASSIPPRHCTSI